MYPQLSYKRNQSDTFASVRWPNFLNASLRSASVVDHERLPTKQRYSSASNIWQLGNTITRRVNNYLNVSA